MTIDDYVQHSRRCRPPSENFSRKYYPELYSLIVGVVPKGAKPPKLHVSYSTDRRCELVSLGHEDFLVYDQHMGQTFARLNRIMHAVSSPRPLAMAYCSKYLAQRLVGYGCLHYAHYFALLQRLFLQQARADGDPFEMSEEQNTRRAQITIAQECFVLAHELSHYIWRNPSEDDLAEVLDETLEILKRLAEPLDREQVNARYGSTTYDHLESDRQSRYDSSLRVFNEHKTELGPELLCDKTGVMVAYEVCHRILNLPIEVICEGFLLSIKYLRLIHHLEAMVAELAIVSRTHSARRRAWLLDRLHTRVWGSESDRRLLLATFRERRLRDQLYLHTQTVGGDVAAVHWLLADRTDEYDRRIEGPIVFDFAKSIRKFFSKECDALPISRQLTQDQLLQEIDKATGWA